jgi:hypothetical protein
LGVNVSCVVVIVIHIIGLLECSQIMVDFLLQLTDDCKPFRAPGAAGYMQILLQAAAIIGQACSTVDIIKNPWVVGDRCHKENNNSAK